MTKDQKFIAVNRKAGHDFFLEERFEAGIILEGTEVKSLRNGRMSIAEGYALMKGNEIWLIGAHIPPYLPAGQFNHNPKRDRKLLLNSREMNKIRGKLTSKGYTLVPLKCYFKNGLAKIEIALARGKRKYDKRESIKKKAARREMKKYKR